MQAPKNNVEENFKVISDQKSLDDIIKRASKRMWHFQSFQVNQAERILTDS